MNRLFSAAAAALCGVCAFAASPVTELVGVPMPKVERPGIDRQTSLPAPMPGGMPAHKVFRAPSSDDGYTVMGYQTEANYGNRRGFYRINSDAYFEHISIDEYTARGYSLNQGWLRNGRLCVVAEYSIFGTTTDYRYLEVDPYTGAILENHAVPLEDPVTEFPNYLPVYVTAAYSPSDDTLYGYTCNEAGTGFVFFKAPGGEPTETQAILAIDPTDPELYSTRCASLCFSTADDCLYGINRANKFVKIARDGSQETVFDLPANMATLYKLAGMVYQPQTNKILWEGLLADYTYGLYEIDPVAKTVTRLSYFDNREQFSFLFQLPDADDPAPIRCPEIDEKRYDHTGGSALISYFMPDSYFNGKAVSGDMKWYALVDGEDYEDGTAAPGDIVDVNFTKLTTGPHTFEFYVEQNGKKSARNTLTSYVGFDTPLATASVTLEENYIEWEPVTRTVNSGYLDPASMIYRVYINGEEVGTTKDTRLDYTLPVNEPYASYYASVVVDNGGMLSTATNSESVRVGRPWDLDVEIGPTKAQSAVCSAFDLDGDTYVWSFSADGEGSDTGFFAVPPLNYSGCNDWLFMPPMNFDDPDAVYEISFEVTNNSKYYVQRLGSFLHADLDPRENVAVIQETRDISPQTPYTLYSQNVAIKTPGTYYLSFFTDNAMYTNGLRLRNITVKKHVIEVPLPTAVTSLEAKGAEKGALKAVVSFDMPVKYISEAEIPADADIRAVITSGENSVEITGKAGSHHQVEIETLQGYNSVTVTTFSGTHKGQEISQEVFTGVDVPGPVTSMDGYVTEDNLSMVCHWTAPTSEGENGFYIDPDDVSYYLMEYGDEGWQIVKDLGKGVYDYTVSVAPGSKLATARFGIAPATVQGRCSTVAWLTDVLGTPYTLPITETFENASYTYRPIRIIRLDDDYQESEWGVVNPRLIDDSMENESGVASYGRSEVPGTKGMLMLPKVSTVGCNDAGIVFEMWTGRGAADITILAETFDSNGMEVIGKVPTDLEGWQRIEFVFPDYMQDHKWVAVYIDAYFEDSDRYVLFSNYSMRGGLTGADVMFTGEGTVTAGQGFIRIEGYEGQTVGVWSLDGAVMTVCDNASESETVNLPAGIYVVKAGDTTLKTIVK